MQGRVRGYMGVYGSVRECKVLYGSVRDEGSIWARGMEGIREIEHKTIMCISYIHVALPFSNRKLNYKI